MKNILGTTEDLQLFNHEGVLIYSFYTFLDGLMVENIYDENKKKISCREFQQEVSDGEITIKNLTV